MTRLPRLLAASDRTVLSRLTSTALLELMRCEEGLFERERRETTGAPRQQMEVMTVSRSGVEAKGHDQCFVSDPNRVRGELMASRSSSGTADEREADQFPFAAY